MRLINITNIFIYTEIEARVRWQGGKRGGRKHGIAERTRALNHLDSGSVTQP